MAAKGDDQPLIDISSLPDISKAEADFHDTSFFQCDPSLPLPQLPTPASLFQESPDRGYGVIRNERLKLAVKYGSPDDVRLEEAQSMRAIRQAFPHNDVPVPEVFGWRKQERRTFIYMSLIGGPTLRQVWSSLTDADKESICCELSRIVTALRRVSQGSSDRFIGKSLRYLHSYAVWDSTLSSLSGSVNGGTVQDRFFKLDYEEGPFLSIKSFNDWLLAAATRRRPGPDEVIDGPYRDLLPDTGDIYFTHGDLTLGNIIVSGIPGSQRIVGIVDWEQAGWYPEYWEYCKALCGVEYTHEWRTHGWAEKLMKPFDDAWTAYAEYSLWRCP
jgi:hypothetical protein